MWDVFVPSCYDGWLWRSPLFTSLLAYLQHQCVEISFENINPQGWTVQSTLDVFFCLLLSSSHPFICYSQITDNMPVLFYHCMGGERGRELCMQVVYRPLKGLGCFPRNLATAFQAKVRLTCRQWANASWTFPSKTTRAYDGHVGSSHDMRTLTAIVCSEEPVIAWRETGLRQCVNTPLVNFNH